VKVNATFQGMNGSFRQMHAQKKAVATTAFFILVPHRHGAGTEFMLR
jgi:hypothetical protein